MYNLRGIPFAATMALRRDQPLAGTDELRIGLAVPSVLSARLDALVGHANDAGVRTNRKELVGAIILRAAPDSERLAQDVKRFRMARVEDALIEGEPESRFLKPERPGPGPRRRRNA